MGSASAMENALDDAGGRKGRPYKTDVAGLGGRLGPTPPVRGPIPPGGGGEWPKANRGRDNVPKGQKG